MLDIEIGSSSDSFNNSIAIQVLAKSLIRVFDCDEPLKTLLCVGGVHFEKSCSWFYDCVIQIMQI